MDIAVQRVETTADPVEAFAKLRSYTPDRGAFLFESRDPAHPRGRFSVLGYRVRGGESTPPFGDAVSAAARAEAVERPESFAAALALGSSGAFTACAANRVHRVSFFDDEWVSSMFDVGSTVMVFDHHDRTITAAGPAQGNLVPRLIYELEHGPAIAPVALAEAPEALTQAPSADNLVGRARRAQSFIEDDELTGVVLAQRFGTRLDGDPFDAYRALRERVESPFSYYVDFGRTPVTPSLQLFGVADEVLYARGRDDDGTLGSLAGALCHPRIYGPEPKTALTLLRRLEDESRQFWGGAVGWFCPGGEATFFLADRMVTVTDEQATVTVGATVTTATDPATLPARARQDAAPLLAALGSAIKR